MLFSWCEGFARFDTVPFLQAAPAAGTSRMLGDEDRMPFHRGLAAVVRYDCRGKPGCNQFFSVSCNGLNAFLMDVPDLLRLEVPAHAEPGMGECQQPFGDPFRLIFKEDGRLCGDWWLCRGFRPEVWLMVSGERHF